MADFDLFKVKVIDQFFKFSEKSLTLTNRRQMMYCASKLVPQLAAPSSMRVKS